jgi:hypothetical protein
MRTVILVALDHLGIAVGQGALVADDLRHGGASGGFVAGIRRRPALR